VSQRCVVKFLVFAALSTGIVGCGHSDDPKPVDQATAMKAVQDYGQGQKTFVTGSNPQTPAVEPANAGESATGTTAISYSDPERGRGGYKSHVALMLAEEHFDQVEKEAQQDRTSKAMMAGGDLKLSVFYSAVGNPPGDKPREADWVQHFKSLRKWIAAYPQSATARIALAKAYVNYGWFARGGGYADKVSASGWDLFGERMGMAKATLVEAAKLKERCPVWYEVMLDVAQGEGWDREQIRELFDAAAAFEPNDLSYYQSYAMMLLPKWYGEEGETQAFAEEMAKKLGDLQGSIVYYQIATVKACQCDKEMDSLEGMDWARVKAGYENLKNTYGITTLDANQFAYMSFVAGDREASREAFDLAGDEVYFSVWRNKDNFKNAKAWAAGS
jgi:hypothetical protein